MTAPDVWVTASGWSTAHLIRTAGERPVTVCGRIVRKPREVGVSFRRCHYCAGVAAERAKEAGK